MYLVLEHIEQAQVKIRAAQSVVPVCCIHLQIQCVSSYFYCVLLLMLVNGYRRKYYFLVQL